MSDINHTRKAIAELGVGEQRPVGRPSKWRRLLIRKKRKKSAISGPYKTRSSAIANASYFNKQLRLNRPKAASRYFFQAFVQNDEHFVACRHVGEIAS